MNRSKKQKKLIVKKNKLILMIFSITIVIISVFFIINSIDYTNKQIEKEKNVTLSKDLYEGQEILLDTNLDGKEEIWIVLNKNEDNIEIISKYIMGELTLGYEDSYLDWDNKEIRKKAELDNNKRLSDIEKGIYSYNNAISTLNSYCNSLIKISNLGVRSVGGNSVNLKNDKRTYLLQNYERWENKQIWEKYKKLIEQGEICGLYQEFLDNPETIYYNEDYKKMKQLNIIDGRKNKNEGECYWLNVRMTGEMWQDDENFGLVNFAVSRVFTYTESEITGKSLIYIDSTGRIVSSIEKCGVRPIIKLKCI